MGDNALRKLFESYPDNNNLETVWLKVTVINSLYNAGVIDTFKMAKHIAEEISNFDTKIKQGDIGLIEEIRKGHGIRRKKSGKEIDFYSFATKYCFEYSLEQYPIYDSYVSKMILLYKHKDHF